MRADVGQFRRDVYAVVGEIPRGRVLTYGQVARIVGWPNHARLVGRVLHGAAEWSGVPCHRVVNRFGQLSGSFAFGGARAQREKLDDVDYALSRAKKQ